MKQVCLSGKITKVCRNPAPQDWSSPSLLYRAQITAFSVTFNILVKARSNTFTQVLFYMSFFPLLSVQQIRNILHSTFCNRHWASFPSIYPGFFLNLFLRKILRKYLHKIHHVIFNLKTARTFVLLSVCKTRKHWQISESS